MIQVISESPYLATLVILVVVGSVMLTIRFCWNRLLRHLNIRKAGWPPSHLDADGDWKPIEKGQDHAG